MSEQASQQKKNKKFKKPKMTREEIEKRKQEALLRQQDKEIQPFLNRIKIAVGDNMLFCVQIVKCVQSNVKNKSDIKDFGVETLHKYLTMIVDKLSEPDYSKASDMVLCLISPIEPIYDEKSETESDPERKRIAVSLYVPNGKEFTAVAIMSEINSDAEQFKSDGSIVSFDWKTNIPLKDVDIVNAKFIEQMKKFNCYPEEEEEDDSALIEMMNQMEW